MPQLTPEQISEVRKEMVYKGTPVRFLYNGCCLNITTGHVLSKGTNVIHQHVYWGFTTETSHKIARWLGVRAVFDQTD